MTFALSYSDNPGPRLRGKTGTKPKLHSKVCLICGKTWIVNGFRGAKRSTCSLHCLKELRRRAVDGIAPACVRSGNYIPWNKGTASPEVAQKEAWASEWASAKKYDETRHWNNHPEAVRWYSNRIARSQYYKWRTDICRRLKRRLRHRIWKMLHTQGAPRTKRTMDLTGCDAYYLRQHLENQFSDGMNWENYGRYWEVDHKRPCASFDLHDENQAAQCFHFSNLQPLKKSENRKKHSNWNGRHHRHRRTKAGTLPLINSARQLPTLPLTSMPTFLNASR